jgi:YD repeat-containing protein
MVAVLTNLGLGLANASSRLLGLRGMLGDPTQGRVGEQVYVNAASGNLVIQHRDDVLIGRGPDSNVSRTYNSLGAFTDDNGDNWRVVASRVVAGLTGTVNTAGSTVSFTDDDGSVTVYAYNATLGKYLSTAGEGAYDTIAWNAGGATWARRDGASGLIETFDSAHGGRLTKIADLSGNEITYAYDSNGYLSQATTANGEIATYDYNSSGQLLKVQTSDGTNTLTRVRYTYDSSNRLSAVTIDLTPGDNSVSDGAAYVTNYAYDGSSKRVAQITQSDGSRLDISYDGSGRVSGLAQTVASGVTRATIFAYGANSTVITDALGQVTTLAYDSAGQLTQITAPAVNGVSQVQTFAYNANGDVTSITDAANLTSVFEYDGSGNLTLSRDPSGATATRTYSVSNQLLTQTVYAGLDPDGNGSGTAALPQTTRYVYDADDNLRFKVSPEGRVTDYRYDGFGQQNAVITYTANAYDVSSLGMTASISLSAMTTWVDAIGDKSTTTRTDIAYDPRGAVSSVTTFGKVNTDGTGYTADEVSKTVYVYDTYGNLLERRPINGSSAAEVYVYDGMGRQISATDLNSATTTVNFEDANGKTKVTLANGLVKTSQYSKSGELLSVTEDNGATAVVTARYAYDELGRLRFVEDATLKKTHVLYDAAGRKVADIAPDGALTEYRYDARNLLIATIAYGTLLSASQLASLVDGSGNPISVDLSTLLPTGAASDRWSWRIYDVSGQLTQTIDAAGAVQAFAYDGAGRLVSSLAYDTMLGSVAGFKTTLPLTVQTIAANNAKDRASRNFYSADGLMIGVLDGEGYLTEIKYDQAGRKTETICFAGATTASLRAAGSFDDLRTSVIQPSVSAEIAGNDVHSYYLYDSRGLLRAEVDGEGDVTLYRYNPYGDVDQIVRGAKIAANTSPTLTNLTAAVAAATRTEVTDYSRSVYGDILTQTLTLAGATETSTFAYDLLRQRISESRPDVAGARNVLRRFDKQGRLTGELRGEGAVALLALGGSPTQTQIDNVYNTHGVQYLYDAAGRLISKRTPNGVDAAGLKTFYFYDVDGRLRIEINASGEVVEYRYSVFGDKTSRIVYGTRLGSGDLTGLTGGFVSSGLESALDLIRDVARDSKTQAAYDVRGRVTSTTDALSKATTYDYNAFGEEVSHLKPFNGAAFVESTRAYDRRGLLERTTEDVGGLALTELRAYDAFGRLSATTDAREVVRIHHYDRVGRTVEVVDGLGHGETMSYDAFGNVITLTDRNGATTTYGYEAFNRKVTTTTAEGIVATVKTNAFGQTISIADGRGGETTYKYDRDGSLKEARGGSGGATILGFKSYDSAGRLWESVDERGIKTKFEYDATNRLLTKTVDPDGLALATRYEYDAKGQGIATISPANVRTEIEYDLNGRQTKVKLDPAGLNIVTLFEYNEAGDQVRVTEGYGSSAARVTRYDYDKSHRRTTTIVDPSMTAGDGRLNIATAYTYDKAGNVVAVTGPGNAITRYVFDAEGRQTYEVDSEGGVTKYSYHSNGALAARLKYARAISLSTAPLETSATQIEAALAARSSAPETENQQTIYIYDQDGRQRFVIDGAGAVIERRYDGANNVVQETAYATAIGSLATLSVQGVTAVLLPSPTTDRVTRFAYDVFNRLAFKIDAEGGVTGYTRDAAGNITKETQSAVRYEASGVPDLAAMTAWAGGATGALSSVQDARITQFVYDNAGRATYTLAAYTVQVAGADVERHYVVERQYDAVGNVKKLIEYMASYEGAVAALNSTSVPSTGARITEYIYDKAGRLLSETKKGVLVSGAPSDVTTSYSYNALGNKKSVIDPRLNAGYFFYDKLGRVIMQVDPERYVTKTEYYANGSTKSVKRFENALAQGIDLASVTDAPADPTASAKDAVTAFEYDALGRLTKVTDAESAYEAYKYDALGNQIEITNKKGGITQKSYDKSGRISEEWVRAATVRGTQQDIKTTYGYDVLGNLSEKVEAANFVEDARTTKFTHDRIGRLLSKSADLLDSFHFPETFGTASLVKVESDRAEFSKYDARGNLIETIDPGGGRTLYYYDLQDRKVAELGPEGALTTYDLDAVGNVTCKTTYGATVALPATAGGDPPNPPSGSTIRETEYFYDANNRLIETRVSGVDVFEVSPGANGPQLLPSPSPQTLSTFLHYDAAGNVIQTQDARGNSAWSYYDKLGRKTADVDAARYLTTYTLDQNGNVKSETKYAVAISATTVVNAASPVTDLINAAGGAGASGNRVTTFEYDRNGHKLKEARAGVSVTAWDSSGNQTEATLVSEIAYQYNALGQIVLVTQAEAPPWRPAPEGRVNAILIRDPICPRRRLDFPAS